MDRILFCLNIISSYGHRIKFGIMTDFMLDDGTYVNIGDELMVELNKGMTTRIKIINLKSRQERMQIDVSVLSDTPDTYIYVAWWVFKDMYVGRYVPIKPPKYIKKHKL